MQAIAPLETIIENGWHHLSVPRYQEGETPRLQCWCGAHISYASDVHQMTHFVNAHAECRPNLAFLEGGAHASS